MPPVSDTAAADRNAMWQSQSVAVDDDEQGAVGGAVGGAVAEASHSLGVYRDVSIVASHEVLLYKVVFENRAFNTKFSVLLDIVLKVFAL